MKSLLRSAIARVAVAGLAVTGLSALQPAEAKFAQMYNHPDLKWYSIETEHFVVHYPVSKKSAEDGNDHYMTGEWSARKIAKVSEDMWAPMCEQFNYFLKEQIHIVLLNQPDGLEGFTVPNFDWIEISANPGKSFARSRGRMEWFSDVMVHEFAHVVSLKANSPFSEAALGVSIGGLYQDGINDVDTGVELFVGDGDSVFWTEGGAEYWSDNAGWNWWTASRDQNIRMTVLQERLLTYDEWHSRSGKRGLGRWNDHERYYQQGYSFGQYLRQRFGDETYARFALEYGKAWRPEWSSVIEDVVGVDAETLYNDWVAYVTERYTKQRERIVERGLVEGHEMAGFGFQPWEYSTPSERDKWVTQTNDKGHHKGKARAKFVREGKRERTGTYQWEPRVSPDGKYWASVNYGTIGITVADEDQFAQFSGRPGSDGELAERTAMLSTGVPASWEHGYDFFHNENKLVITGYEDYDRSEFWNVTGGKPELDGYGWDELWIVDLDKIAFEKKEGNRTVQTTHRKWPNRSAMRKGVATAIPNTFRGSNPAISPDGTKVAYLEYTDGTLNLVTINVDGTDKKHLTDWSDGTWFQGVDWSPDGKKLVFSMFRQYQQNLYVMDLETGEMEPLMWDAWEEADPHWGHDGRIYFSADVDGVWNAFNYDPETGDFRQLTNVVSGAVSPQLTPDGNLVYNYYDSHGWKIYGLAKDEFFNRPANHYFVTDVDDGVVKASMEQVEDLSYLEAQTTKYKWTKSLMAPHLVPLIRLDNDSRTNWGLSAGFQFMIQDFVEHHGVYLYPSLGEDTLFLGQYFYQGWYPNFFLTGYHYEVKYNSGFLLDDDDDPNTTEDQTIWEIRRQQSVDILGLAMQYPWTARFDTTLYAQGRQFAFKSTDDSKFSTYSQALAAGLTASFSNAGGEAANYNRGRSVELNLSHNWADIVYEPYGGVTVDDGELLDKYQYNELELRYTEFLRVPGWGKLLSKARSKGHALQIDTRFGYIDRNVDANNEFRAGGQHPFFWGYGTLRPNTLFAGYPPSSLSGETMAILNLAYRFPVHEWHRVAVGPLFFHGLYAQFGATAGNLWSFRPPEESSKFYRNRYGERIAYDKADVKREIPLIDEAYKNGNYLLYDAMAEIRLASTMFHTSSWDSFVRFAYGFNEVRGYGDVDGDDIYDTSDNAFGDELSNETEKPGLRVYIGLGTGW
ncbi:MAG: PD40 domain-containing protein [Alphaproteobacteria bacterium]|nr:PD40 domain-containing protein [Alphaproteobacteria bacterium]